MIAVAIFLTYGLQFYVPMEIIWKSIGHNFGAYKLAAEYALRVLLVLATGEHKFFRFTYFTDVRVSFIFRHQNAYIYHLNTHSVHKNMWIF
jgi:hypothetical protein